MPDRCDVFGQYFTDKKRISHIGFIEVWEDGDACCITVEGNTNGEGGNNIHGVYKKRRLKSQIYKVTHVTQKLS
jgi:hypothetical protein